MIASMPIINVDVDGVLYDFTGQMRNEIMAVTGRLPATLPEADQWDLTEAWRISVEQFDSIMFDAIAQGRLFRRGELIGFGIATRSLQAIIDLGWHVRLVSSKTFKEDAFITMQARKNMLDWLYENSIPHHTVAFSDGMGKRSYQADAVVDDKPTIEWTQWGADNFLFDQPWNQNVHTVETGIVRVKSLAGVLSVLESGTA
jgi:hypothetical protein